MVTLSCACRVTEQLARPCATAIELRQRVEGTAVQGSKLWPHEARSPHAHLKVELQAATREERGHLVPRPLRRKQPKHKLFLHDLRARHVQKDAGLWLMC